MSGRCLACNDKLSDFEMTRKYAGTDRYVGLCNDCFYEIPNFPPVEERGDLAHNEYNLPDDVDFDDEEYGEHSCPE